MEIPNLDAMTGAELQAFWFKWHRTSTVKAATLIGPRKEVRNVVEILANYAINKSTAIMCRVNGNIESALKYEEACQIHYDRLPKDCRW